MEHTLYLCKIPETENEFVVIRSISVVAWEWEGGGESGMDYQESIRKLLREMNIFIILMMEITSQLYTYVQSHHIVPI